MTLPRSKQISLANTPYYHCVARCVRRAFLCGRDDYTGQNFDHRKQWLLDRLKRQAAVFSIDICAYAIMSNHYHLVLHIDPGRADRWSDDEVMERWTSLFSGPILVQRYRAGETLSEVQQRTVAEVVAVWRKRLSDISWYMRCLNEFIARRANEEDKCTGRFWEGRFRSQALLDQAAVLSCMAYVDLNPLRAGIASDLAGSDFTSVQARLQPLQSSADKSSGRGKAVPLLGFSSQSPSNEDKAYLPVQLRDYLELVDITVRCIAAGKPGCISPDSSRLLDQLELSPAQWQTLSLDIQRYRLGAIGSGDKLQTYGRATGRKRMQLTAPLKLAYGS